MDGLLHGGEVAVPQKLRLLTQGEHPRQGHLLEGSQDLGRGGRKGEGVRPCQALADPGVGAAAAWGWGAGNQKPSPVVLRS